MASPLSRFGLLAVGLALVGTVGAWVIEGGTMFSPGPLRAEDSRDSASTRLGGISSHDELTRRCDACHAAPWARETMARRCLDCHTDTRAELRDTTSLHGRLVGGAACIDCHTEHRGPAGNLTRIETIAHDRLGFSLTAHRRTSDGDAFTCRDCHAATTYRFEPERCGDCHREYQAEFVARHVSQWGADCMSCHDGTDRFSRGVFDHSKTQFALTGAHAKTACLDCHARTRTLEEFRAAPTECVGCHRDDDTHRGEFGADCGACHGTDTWDGARMKHEFPLDHGGEGTIACRTCHEDRQNYKAYTCYGCHEHSPARIRDKHDEEGITGRELENCVRCHPTGREHEGDRSRGDRRDRRGDRRRER